LRERYADDPEFVDFVAGFDQWQDSNTLRRFRPAIEAARNGEGQDPRALAMLRAVRDADAGAPELYRGISRDMTAKAALAEYKKGEVLDFTVSSFSSVRGVAEEFSKYEKLDRPLEVVFTVRGGSHALKVEALSQLWDEREWLAVGRYRVVSSKKTGRYGERIEVTLEQVE
jgi:hypothetical protein